LPGASAPMHPICGVAFCARSVAYCEYAPSRARRLLAAGAPGHRIPRGAFRPRSWTALLESRRFSPSLLGGGARAPPCVPVRPQHDTGDPQRRLGSMPESYCVGPSMAVDWGEDQPVLTRRLLQRVFCYFLPYWRRGLVVLLCIGVGAALGLVPALVTKALIDYLAHPPGGFGPLALIVSAGVAAT